ncbi:uncharacterized protein A1O9_04148 [Exophiala aquamarina CBS 119918]|uniref:Zn(2)-C6 fungal-type domain-containing protein n=1 Tax=Exophiala aquamarina CBS 119918 TaxID=1182545 RepID=A0A072PGT9_9EURO|nr:uncharacterized protein A1O9_04148 [Exophiala aquamarina CBS 119918]KEF59304.1 hypothetical protein A1O9_04148 [Exophiala aquamarina CBS 119918]
MRSPTACAQCRRAKRRCIRNAPSEACAPCEQRQLLCEENVQVQLGGQRPLVPRSAAVASTLGQSPERQIGPRVELSRGIVIELVDHYLDKFDGRPHSIFHPATLRSSVHNGTLNEALLYAICAIGCKFSGNPDLRSQGSFFATESRRLLQADISNICLENIQACILIAMLSVGHGDSASEALFIRIATAMAEIMNVNSPALEGSIIDREIRRRVWCSLYMTDMWCISGQGLHSQMKDVEVKVELPMNDSTFSSLKPDQVSVIDPPEHGIWAHMMTLVPLFRPIYDINRRIANGEVHNVNLDQEVEQLARDLLNWKNMLPFDAQMNQTNLLQQQRNGLGGLLISIHLAYHHFSILLYFRYLEAQQETSSTDRIYTARCKTHASSFSSLLRQARQLKSCDVVYPNISHMVTVSSSVLLHTLLFGELDELATVRQELNSNFEALIDLTQYWPSTSAMIERLVVFQDMCLLSTEPGTHKLDGWMLRFLIEHSLDFEAKKTKVNPISLPIDLDKLSLKGKELVEQGRYLSFRSQ